MFCIISLSSSELISIRGGERFASVVAIGLVIVGVSMLSFTVMCGFGVFVICWI